MPLRIPCLRAPRRACRLAAAAGLLAMASLAVAWPADAAGPFAPPSLAVRLVVHPGQSVNLAGTDLYGVVTMTSQGVALFGEVVPPRARRATGYFFVAQDGGVAVAKQGRKSASYVLVRSEPALHTSVAAPRRARGMVTLRLGEAARIDGTALVLAAGRNPNGDPSLAVVLMPRTTPLEGSFEAGISEHEVVLLRWHAGTARPVFTRAEPGTLPPTTTTPSTTTLPTTTTPATTPSPAGNGDIGKSVTLDGVRVKLLGVAYDVPPRTVYDQLTGPSVFDTVTLQITNVGSADYFGTSNGSTAINGTDGKTYWPDTSYGVAGCEDFGSGGATGAIDLPPGRSETGCVHFIAPTGVKATIVAFSPLAQWGRGQYIVWNA